MYENLKKLILDNEKIIIFRHLVGDGDALGSQWGLYHYLQDKYPKKEIYVVGDDTLGYEGIFDKPHQISDNKFNGALAIVLDTANTARISDQRFSLCKNIVKIDHHLDVDAYGDLNIVDSNVSSTAEMLTNILKRFENSQPLSKIVAKNLYLGIISDTLSFTVPLVDEKTFETAAYLSKSQIKVGELTRLFNEIDLEMYKFKIHLSTKIVFKDSGLAYIKVDNSDLKKFNISHAQAKRFVSLMGNIKGINIWVLFIEQKENAGIFDASLRSNEIVINDVAQQFGGGGHMFASGVKSLDTKLLNQLLIKLQAKF